MCWRVLGSQNIRKVNRDSTYTTYTASEVPSAFFIGDCMLRLDSLMQNHLLVPGPGTTREDLALTEGKRMKKLLGYLRHLFRNSA